MAKTGTRTIETPEGVDLTIQNETVKVKGPKGELVKELSYPGVSIKKEGGVVSISTSQTDKKSNAVVGTFQAHLRNMFKGVTEGYTAEMKAVFAHFPITIKQAEDIIEIHNFLGEKVPRKAKVFGDAKMKIEKDIIIIEGTNKEDVGQTTANIEQATKVKRKDVRIFQDGVYVTRKA